MFTMLTPGGRGLPLSVKLSRWLSATYQPSVRLDADLEELRREDGGREV